MLEGSSDSWSPSIEPFPLPVLKCDKCEVRTSMEGRESREDDREGVEGFDPDDWRR